MTCPRCEDEIRGGQLTVTRDAVVRGRRARVVMHVACPTRRQIARRYRMGRA